MKNYMKIIFLIVVVFTLSGCSFNLAGIKKTATGGFLVNIDGGNNWVAKNYYDEKTNISGVDILTMAVDPVNSNTVYLGSVDNGIFSSNDGGGKWTKNAEFLATKVYGIAINHQQPETIYATGVLGKRGKIFRTDDQGVSWREIYSEPADGTLVISLAISKVDPQIVYAGTSKGTIVKTYDGGNTWKDFYAETSPITKIVIDEKNENAVYFLVLGDGVLVTKDNGSSFAFLGKNKNKDEKDVVKFPSSAVKSIIVDPNNTGVAYIGTSEGMFKSSNFGDNITEVNIIGSSKKFPIYAVAVNPNNSNEIVYAAAQAIYMTNDGGTQWSVFQLDTKKSISALKYNINDSSKIYAGLRDF
jgi:photosystem II stability/assembly factor-like uncharacterized protein